MQIYLKTPFQNLFRLKRRVLFSFDNLNPFSTIFFSFSSKNVEQSKSHFLAHPRPKFSIKQSLHYSTNPRVFMIVRKMHRTMFGTNIYFEWNFLKKFRTIIVIGAYFAYDKFWLQKLYCQLQ